MSDISEWIDKHQEAIQHSFGLAAKEVMDAWAVFIVSRMKDSRQSYPSMKPISIYLGKLARGIQGQEGTTDNYLEEQLSYERTIKVPYAAISEFGGNIPATQSMRRAMFAKLKEMGRYNPNTVWTHKAVFEHKPFEFVKDSIEGMTSDKIEPIIRRNLETELNKVPNFEVTVGN